MKTYAILFLLIAFLFSCEAPETIIKEVEVPREVDFEEVDFSRGIFQRYFNIQKVGESLIVQGENRIGKVNLGKDNDNCYWIWKDSHKEAITEDFYLNTSQQSIHFWSSKSGSICSDQLRTKLLNDSIDQDINPNDLTKPKFLDHYSLISEAYVLYPYSQGTEQKLKLALIRLNFDSNSGIYARVFPDSVQRIEIPGAAYRDYTFQHWSVEGGFIFSIAGLDPAIRGTYKITFDGTYQKISEQLFFRMFNFQERLYAMYDYFGQSYLIESSDKGLSWTQRFVSEGIVLAAITFYEIEGQLIGHWNGQIVLVEEFDSTSFKTVELNARELETHYITSMAKLGENVYISTLSGLFYRNWEEFLMDKK